MPSFYTAVGGVVVEEGQEVHPPPHCLPWGLEPSTCTERGLGAGWPLRFLRVFIIAPPHFKLREKNGVRLILRCAWQKEYQGTLEEKEIEREMEGR